MVTQKREPQSKGINRYRIRITAGDHIGRYVGQRFGGGMMTNPDMRKNPPVNIQNSGYGLYVQEAAATQYFEGKTEKVEAELNALGYSTELVEVN